MPPRLPLLTFRPKSNTQCLFNPSQKHSFSTAHPRAQSASNARWLSDMKVRIGKCIIFGMDKEQTRKAAGVSKILGQEWRELVAGREGFLTDSTRAGLRRHKVVWGEMDSMGHVNNVTYIRYAESARTQWVINYGIHHDPTNRQKWEDLLSPRDEGLILRSIRTDFKFPMTWPDHISVFHKLQALPKSSDSNFVLDVMILSELHQRPSARCIEESVVYNYKVGRKMEIPPFMMEAFRTTWEEQEAEKQRVAERYRVVEDTVTELEKGTWDREDAVEDKGSA